MEHLSLFGVALQLDGTTLFLVIVGGVIIWLLMTFLFASSDSDQVEIMVQTESIPSLPMDEPPKKIDPEKAEEDAKKEALRRKKQRERRKEFFERFVSTVKKAAMLLLESSWMIGLSVAIILTVYFITQNMLIE